MGLPVPLSGNLSFSFPKKTIYMESFMKKSIRFMAAALLLAGATSAYAAGKSGRAELKVWESSGPESTYILAAIKEYRKINPKVKISYEAVGHTDSRAKIELDGPAGVGADIFVSPHDHMGALVAAGNILPVDDAEEYMENFYDMAKIGSKYNGVNYGYPLAAETYALVYNKDLVKNPPKTWDDVKAFAKTFNNKTEGKYALVWSVGDGYYDYMFMESFGAPLFGKDGNDRSKHNLNSPEAINGLKFFQNLRKEILDIPASDANGDFCNAQFTEGKSAMVITGPWSLPSYKAAGLNIGVVRLPAFPGTDHATSFSGVRLAFVSSWSKYPEEAKAFAKFLTSRDMLKKRYELTDQIPPRNDIQVNDPLINGFKEQLAYARAMPTIPQLGIYWSSMNSAYAEIWDGGDVKRSLDSAAATMEAAK